VPDVSIVVQRRSDWATCAEIGEGNHQVFAA